MGLSLSVRCLPSNTLQSGLLYIVAFSLMNIWTSPSLSYQKQVRGWEAKSPPVSWKTSNCFIKCQRTQSICLISSVGACVGFEVPSAAGALCVSLRQLHRQTATQVLAASLLVVCSNWVNTILQHPNKNIWVCLHAGSNVSYCMSKKFQPTSDNQTASNAACGIWKHLQQEIRSPGASHHSAILTASV